MSLTGKAALVVGGVGPVGRAIARGLLQAGATVTINSRSEAKLVQLHEDLGHPERLHCVHGTMLPSGLDKTMERVFDIGTPTHVVAHCGVAWWGQAGDEDETGTLTIPKQGASILEMERDIFRHNAGVLVDLHFGVAQALIPKLRHMEGASYTYITGTSAVTQRQLSSLTRINAHHVSGLASALRAEAKSKADSVFMSEVRVGKLPIRNYPELSKDPSAMPMTAHIGMLTAGIAQAAERWPGPQAGGDLHTVGTEAELHTLLKRFPVEEVAGPKVPALWHWETSAHPQAVPTMPTGED